MQIRSVWGHDYLRTIETKCIVNWKQEFCNILGTLARSKRTIAATALKKFLQIYQFLFEFFTCGFLWLNPRCHRKK